MSRWFRVYDDLVDDPKVQLLPAEMFKTMVNLWCLASQNNGVLPNTKTISFKLRISQDRVAEILSELKLAGLLDEHGKGGFCPHNWNERQFKSDASTERVKRFRNGKRNGNETLHETELKRPQSQRQSTDSETEKKERKKDAASNEAGAKAPPTPEVELFRRGREILGPKAGGVIVKLLAAKDNNIALARSVLEVASTKSDPREYLGAIIAGRDEDKPYAHGAII